MDQGKENPVRVEGNPAQMNADGVKNPHADEKVDEDFQGPGGAVKLIDDGCAAAGDPDQHGPQSLPCKILKNCLQESVSSQGGVGQAHDHKGSTSHGDAV